MGRIVPGLRETVREKIGVSLERYLEGRPRDMDSDARDPNEAAFEAWRLVPRLFAGIGAPDLSARWFGRTVAAPLVVGAYAADRILDVEGVLPIARAAAALGLPIVISEECLTPLPEIAAANPLFALQIRGAGALERATRLAAMAAEAGASGLVVTALAPAHLRPGLFPGGVDIQAETRARQLVTVAQRGDPRDVSALPAWTFADLAALCATARDIGLEVQLKGVLHPDDARRAIQAGCGGVAVSNLGVRNLYRWAPSVTQLPAVADALAGSASVALDGGVRNASDVIVSLCLGADFVTMVRPVVYAALAGGERGALDFISAVVDDLATICFWMGVPRADSLRRDHLVRI